MTKKFAFQAVLIVLFAAALCVCAWCVWYIVQYYRGAALQARLQAAYFNVPGAAAAQPSAASAQPPDASAQPIHTPFPEASAAVFEPTAAPEAPPPACPVDFAALERENGDIYAWIELPGTNISYPVLQSPDDDAFYMTHAPDKSYFSGGSIYTEGMNARDFSDPMTVLYGHNRRAGDMFAQVNNFADSTFFDEHRTIEVYTPTRRLTYEIFAAYPYPARHLLKNFDFSNTDEFADFFDGALKVRDYRAHYVSGVTPQAGVDRVITLSTCLRGNNASRYLVQGILREETEYMP